MIKKRQDVIVACSGGLDSSLAAALLKEDGRRVYGVHFLLPSSASRRNRRLASARKISEHIGIPLTVLDLEKDFEELVIEPFLSLYSEGLTPNPCVICNGRIKFQYLIRHADQMGIYHIATGHYARVRKGTEDSVVCLQRGKDVSKDQSYFLHRVEKTFLERSVFPLGEITKNEAREMAYLKGFSAHCDPETKEICFIPEEDYRSFFEDRTNSKLLKKGHIVDDCGLLLGEHMGFYRYTVGQRHGLGISSARPYYVKEIRPETNEVVVGRREDLFSRSVEAKQFNWTGEVPSESVVRAHAQVRYRHRGAPGLLEVVSSRNVKFIFDEPQWAITPGQALVCYDGDRVLGGGWIIKNSNH